MFGTALLQVENCLEARPGARRYPSLELEGIVSSLLYMCRMLVLRMDQQLKIGIGQAIFPSHMPLLILPI
jgi:hypothetical protein